MPAAGKTSTPEPLPELRFIPLDKAHWADLEELFGPRGACDGCWCMYLRAGFSADRENNRRLLQQRVLESPAPGLLAYAPVSAERAKPAEEVPASSAEPGWQALAWVAIAPREEYARMQGSRVKVMRALDDRPAWCLTCFYVRSGWRKRGLQSRLIAAAVDFAKQHGASLIEAFPREKPEEKISGSFIWSGTLSTFLRAGFKEVARPTPARPVVRLEIGDR